MNMNMIMRDVDDFDSDKLRNYTLEGNWEEVLKTYNTHNRAWRTKIDGDRGTALHVAVNDGLKDIAKNLIDVIINDEGEDLEDVLKVMNERGDTPLHLAASRGFKNICKLIIGQNGERKHLIKAKNESGETPLFLAALSWKKQTFAYLFKQFIDFPDDPVNLQVLIRYLDGDTILHSAIRREFFDLAVIIIHYCPNLSGIQNQKGMTPLKLLANRPSAFRSGSKLTWWRQIIYNCKCYLESIQVQDLDVDRKLGRYLNKNNALEDHQFGELPPNYRTCYQFFTFGRHLGPALLGGCHTVPKKKLDEGCSGIDEVRISIPHAEMENRKVKIYENVVPPDYATCGQFVRCAFMYVLGLSGALGSNVIFKIKKKHKWGVQLLSALMTRPSEVYMGSGGGGRPIQQYEDEDDITPFYDAILEKEETIKKKQIDTTDTDAEEKIDTKETAFLIAARNGIVEMVRVILSKIPSAIHDTTTDKRNVFHVAVKNKQPLVVELLLKCLTSQYRKNLIQAVDNDDNTVLHLAAETLSSETRPEGSAMQMMWEIKWFEYVKELLPDHFILMKNIKHKTSGELFKESHKLLVDESSNWLKEISGVVAGLVAGVAFATVSTIPGWTEGGKPSLEGQPVFDAFAISSLVALFSSVTALILFLSLLTSHKRAQDFRRNLPFLLLSGLTFMFISIVSMFVSFCTGHFFLLNHKYKQFAFPIYLAACLPLTFYAVAQFPLYLALLYIILLKVPKPLNI